jgi:hypothetical protein
MLLYHGTLDYAAVNIMARKHFIHSNGTHHLLGKGIYLFDDMESAFAWATKQTEKQNKKNPPVLPYKPVVLKVEVELVEETYMNLDSLELQDLFFVARRKFKETVRKYGLMSEVYTDSLFCDFLSHKLNVKLLSNTMLDLTYRNYIPTQMKKDLELNNLATMHFPTERHYCLKDNSLIRNISYGRVGDL